MMVYIVLNTKNNMIESVWSTRELAASAVLYHEMNTGIHRKDFYIAEREVNTAKIFEKKS